MTDVLDSTWQTLDLPEPEPAGEVRAVIEGLPPGLLMHNPAQSVGVKDKTIPAPEVEAERALYRWGDGSLFLPSTAIYASLCEAGKKLKYRDIPDTKYGSRKLLAAGVRALADGFTLLDVETEAPITTYEVHQLPVRVPTGRIMRARPLIAAWRCELTLQFDASVIGDAILRVIVDALVQSGQTVGLLDYRPTTGGPYGRFVVRNFSFRMA
jgi:hypothetical protein